MAKTLTPEEMDRLEREGTAVDPGKNAPSEITPEQMSALEGAGHVIPPNRKEISPEEMEKYDTAQEGPGAWELIKSIPGALKSQYQESSAHDGYVEVAEFRDIVRKNNLNPDQAKALLEMAPYWSASIRGQTSLLEKPSERLQGFLGESAGYGIPGKILVENIKDENLKEAANQVRDMAFRRRSVGEMGGDLVVGAGVAYLSSGMSAPALTAKLASMTSRQVALSAAKQAVKNIGVSATIGGVTGYTGARSGEELQGVKNGLIIGTTFGGVLSAPTILRAGVNGTKAILSRSVSNDISHTTSQVGERAIAAVEKSAEQDAATVQRLSNREELAKAAETWDQAARSEGGIESIREKLRRGGVEFDDLADPGNRAQATGKDLGDLEQYNFKSTRPTETEALRTRLNEESEIKQFADFVNAGGRLDKVGSPVKSMKEAFQVIETRVRKGTIDAEFTNFRLATEALKAADELNISMLPKSEYTWMQKKSNYISGARSVYRTLGQKLGYKGDAILDNLSMANRRYTVELGTELRHLLDMKNSAEKVGLKSDVIYDVLNSRTQEAFDQKMSRLPSAQQDLVHDWSASFERMRNNVNVVYGEEIIPKLKDSYSYVPHHVVELPQFVVRTEQKLRPALQQAGVDLAKGMDTGGLTMNRFGELLKNPEFVEVTKGLELLSGKPITDHKEWLKAYTEMRNPTTAEVTYSDLTSSSSRSREYKIPEFLLERDPYKLYARWAGTSLRNAHYQKGMKELLNFRNVAIAAGDKEATEYLTNHLQDITGIRQTFSSDIQIKELKYVTSLMEKAAKYPEGHPKRLALEAAAETPGMLNFITGQVYPNYLGLSPRAIVQNISQPFFMTIPEVGLAYGAPKLVKAYANLLKSAALGEKIKLTRETAAYFGKAEGDIVNLRGRDLTLAKGLTLDSAIYRDRLKAVRSGINETLKIGSVGDKLDWMAQKALYLFEISESTNRYVTDSIAKDVAADIIAGGSKDSHAFVQNMGKGYSGEVSRAMASGDHSAVERLVSQYLGSKTMFNYDKVSLSEFGREMGPILSAFTRWPTTITGDVIHTYRSKTAGAAARDLSYRYLAPLVLAVTFEKLLTSKLEDSGILEDGTENPVYKKVMGSLGVASMSPVGSVGNVLAGDLLAPPVVASGMEVGTAVLSGDIEEVWLAANKALMGYVPMMYLTKMWTDTLPTILTGDALDKQTPISRVLEKFTGSSLDDDVRDLRESIDDKFNIDRTKGKK